MEKQQDEPRFTIEEIAEYISGWTMGSFDEVKLLGQYVCANALSQLRDDQDGIVAATERRKLRNESH